MPQAITTADVHRGWFDCITCGEILPIFYHQRCPTCHSEFTLLAAQHEEQEGIRQHKSRSRGDYLIQHFASRIIF